MKAFVLLLLCIAAASPAPARAQAEAPPVPSAKPAPPTDLDWATANRANVSLDVKEVSSGRTDASNFKTDYGSYDKDQIRRKVLEVSARNFGKVPATVTIETIWFVRPERPPKDAVGAKAKVAILDRHGDKNQQAMAAGATLRFQTEAEAASSRTRYEALGESYSSGVRFAGWLVVVRDGKKVVAYKASSPTVEALLRNEAAEMATAMKEFAEASKE